MILIAHFSSGSIKSIDIGENNILTFLKQMSKLSKHFKFVKHKKNNSHFFGTVDSKGRPEGIGIVVHENSKLN